VGKVGEIEKVTIFDNNPEGAVAVKFKEAKAAEVCVTSMKGRFFGGQKIDCDFWDGVTNYMVKESEDKEDARLESFGDWLENQSSDEEGINYDYDSEEGGD